MRFTHAQTVARKPVLVSRNAPDASASAAETPGMPSIGNQLITSTQHESTS